MKTESSVGSLICTDASRTSLLYTNTALYDPDDAPIVCMRCEPHIPGVILTHAMTDHSPLRIRLETQLGSTSPVYYTPLTQPTNYAAMVCVRSEPLIPRAILTHAMKDHSPPRLRLEPQLGSKRPLCHKHDMPTTDDDQTGTGRP